MNGTVDLYHKTLTDQSTSSSELLFADYDSAGAILFIIVVLLWYSMGVVCMLGMQIKAHNETVEDCARRRAKLLIETLRDQTHTKQILEELVDKEKRDKLWDIYLGATENNNNDKIIRDEILRIRNIEKQLAVINQNRILINESLVPSTANKRIHSDSQSIVISDLLLIENRARVRRRSSLDQQIIERWKAVVDQCKTHEQLPWTLRKFMIRRHFRRHYKGMLREPEQMNAPLYEQMNYVNNKQCHLVMNRQLTMKNYSLVMNESNHHIIQIDNKDCQ